MSSLPWFRMYSRIMTDPDIEFLSFEDQRHFVWLLCMKNEGYLDKGYEGKKLDSMISRKLGVCLRTLIDIKSKLISAGLIDPFWQPIQNFRENGRPSHCHWSEIRARIFERDNYTCAYCSQYGGDLECDHIHPVALGGTHDDDNLTTACRSCNRSKGAKSLSEWNQWRAVH